MAAILRSLWNLYNFVNDLSDPRTKDWFMLSSPFPVIILLTFYLLFVTKWGPRFMENRQPFNLERILIVFNLMQIIVNIYIFERGLTMGWATTYSWKCEPVDFSYTKDAIEVARLVWLYFLVKVSDLLDTVFFVLKKKQSHVSFLHVYHHTAMVLATWIATKFLPGGHSTFVGLLNAFVHAIMYSYYLFTILYPKYKKIIWWKKYITQMQMIQFLMITIHSSQLIFRDFCGYPTIVAYFLVPQNFFMFILFYDFYRKAYRNKKEI